MSEEPLALIDRPAEFVCRPTPNRPASRNPPNDALLRASTEVRAPGCHQHRARESFEALAGGSLTRALDARDEKLGDSRTARESGEG